MNLNVAESVKLVEFLNKYNTSAQELLGKKLVDKIKSDCANARKYGDFVLLSSLQRHDVNGVVTLVVRNDEGQCTLHTKTLKWLLQFPRLWRAQTMELDFEEIKIFLDRDWTYNFTFYSTTIKDADPLRARISRDELERLLMDISND